MPLRPPCLILSVAIIIVLVCYLLMAALSYPALQTYLWLYAPSSAADVQSKSVLVVLATHRNAITVCVVQGQSYGRSLCDVLSNIFVSTALCIMIVSPITLP